MKTLQIPSIALSHLAQAGRDFITSQYGDVADDLPFMVAPHDNGYFMTVPACAAQADDEQREEFAQIPADLRAIFEYMIERAPFAWFLLDVDGDTVPELPVYLAEFPPVCHFAEQTESAIAAVEAHAEKIASEPPFGVRLWLSTIQPNADELPPPPAVVNVPLDVAPPVQNFRNFYKCPTCGTGWTDVWSAQCDDDCPECGARHITPYTSEDA